MEAEVGVGKGELLGVLVRCFPKLSADHTDVFSLRKFIELIDALSLCIAFKSFKIK